MLESFKLISSNLWNKFRWLKRLLRSLTKYGREEKRKLSWRIRTTTERKKGWTSWGFKMNRSASNILFKSKLIKKNCSTRLSRWENRLKSSLKPVLIHLVLLARCKIFINESRLRQSSSNEDKARGKAIKISKTSTTQLWVSTKKLERKLWLRRKRRKTKFKNLKN